MDEILLRIFQREVERQCKFALIAAQDLTQALETNNLDRFWYSIQSLLVAAGNVSKLLWPPKPLLSDRATELRASLSVDNGSPLEPRTFRNHFEHFDNRLEKWARESVRRGFVDSNVGPPDMIAGYKLADCLRHFDTISFAVTFRGDTYSLQPIIDSIRELWEKAMIQAEMYY